MRGSNAAQGSMTVGDGLRRIFLGWLTAVLVQYLCLPPDLRSLEGLESLAAQSVLLLMGLTALLFVLLCLLARWIETAWLERWAIFAVFGILVTLSLHASFTVPYLLACLLVLVVLGVYAWFGWCGEETVMDQAGDKGRSGRILAEIGRAHV